MQPGWSYTPDFVSRPAALFECLRAQVRWTGQMRARDTASMGIPYNYAGASYPEADWHPAVWAVAEQVGAHLGFTPTNCLLNHYPSGEHSIGWHADDTSILAPGTPIAIVSLGGPRTLQLRSGQAPAFQYERVLLEPGSLFVMDQPMQSQHKHAIKREPGAEPRISLTLRHLTHASSPVHRPAWGR